MSKVSAKRMKDQRRVKRHNCLVPVDGKKGSPWERLCTSDISAQGLGLVAEKAVPLNKKIAVEVLLAPDGEPVILIGRVQWVKHMAQGDVYRLGMKFTDVLSRGSLKKLKEKFK